jgi:hypothetical protein
VRHSWLNYDEVLPNEYRDLAEARALIPEFLETAYNQTRLHLPFGCVRARL